MEKAKRTCVPRAVVLAESARGHRHGCASRPGTELSHCRLEAELFLGEWGDPVGGPYSPQGLEPPRAVDPENMQEQLTAGWTASGGLPVVQGLRLRSQCRCPGSIPGQEAGSHVPQRKPSVAKLIVLQIKAPLITGVWASDFLFSPSPSSCFLIPFNVQA